VIADANERVQDQVQHFAHQVDGDGALRSVSTPSRRRIPAMMARHAPAGRVVVSAEAVEMGYRGLGAPDRGDLFWVPARSVTYRTRVSDEAGSAASSRSAHQASNDRKSEA
jgi:hypothetical protein